MARITVDDCLKRIPNRFQLTLAATYRARSLGTGATPPPAERRLHVDDAGPVGGVLLWFEAELDRSLHLANPPGAGGHWGQHLASFAEERGVRSGGGLDVRFHLDGTTVRVAWA